MANLSTTAPVAHVRFEGRSLDVPFDALGIGPGSGDREVKRAVARYLEAPEVRLHRHVVDRHETGNLTVRPEAVFG
jgi:hypothetical protein